MRWLTKRIFPLVLTLLLTTVGCAVGGGGADLTTESGGGSTDGSGDDSGGESGSGTGVESGGETVPGGGAVEGPEAGSSGLYEGGPVDIPVPIAKIESIDPRYVIVTLLENQLTLRGEAGAVTNVSASPFVWCQETNSGEIKTTASNSDGSFSAITFTLAENEPSTSITLAGYDGTSIGTPVFLRISNNLYVWLLTNGTSVSQGALSMEEDIVYLVLHVGGIGSTTSSSLKRNATTEDYTSSYLYTFEVGGHLEIMATGDIIIDQLFVTEGEVLARAGNCFYIPEGTGFVELFCIGSAETIDEIDVEADYDGKQWIAVATDRAAYVCNRTSVCTEIADFDTISAPATYEGIVSMTWSKYLIGTDPVFFLQLAWEETQNSVTTSSVWNYEPGDELTEEGDNWGWYWWEIDNVDLTGDTPGTYVYKGILEAGVVDNYSTDYRPATWVTSCGSPAGGNVNQLEATIIEMPNKTNYLLDAEVTVNTRTAVVTGNTTTWKDSICYAKQTRVVYDAEIHPNINMNLVFFCAEDENSRGQIYALCGNYMEAADNDYSIGTGRTGYKGVSADSIVQLTEGEEHCTRGKNWKIDRHVAENGNVTTNAVVIVNTSNPLRPQVQLIDPYNEPLLSDCITD